MSSAKILVLGDSGVGKSSLVYLICHSNILTSAQSTIGSSIEVKSFENFFLEFWDIGGSRSQSIARSFLYQDYDAIILVFDATNNKSRLNLNDWLTEVQTDNLYKDFDAPVITIATKKDLLPREYILDDQLIYINTQDAMAFHPNSNNADRLNHFFKQVIHRKFYNNKFAI